MTTAGWIFLGISWTVVIGMTAILFKWTLESGDGDKNFPTA